MFQHIIFASMRILPMLTSLSPHPFHQDLKTCKWAFCSTANFVINELRKAQATNGRPKEEENTRNTKTQLLYKTMGQMGSENEKSSLAWTKANTCMYIYNIYIYIYYVYIHSPPDLQVAKLSHHQCNLPLQSLRLSTEP